MKNSISFCDPRPHTNVAMRLRGWGHAAYEEVYDWMVKMELACPNITMSAAEAVEHDVVAIGTKQQVIERLEKAYDIGYWPSCVEAISVGERELR